MWLSLYPFVACFFGVPCSTYQHLVYNDIQQNLFLEKGLFYYKKPSWPVAKRVYGAIQVRIWLPHDNDLANIPFLPCRIMRDKQKKVYLANCFSCLRNQSRSKCHCGMEQRSFVGVYCELSYLKVFAAGNILI